MKPRRALIGALLCASLMALALLWASCSASEDEGEEREPAPVEEISQEFVPDSDASSSGDVAETEARSQLGDGSADPDETAGLGVDAPESARGEDDADLSEAELARRRARAADEGMRSRARGTGVPLRLERDERAERPAPPTSVDEVAARFFPGWVALDRERTAELQRNDRFVFEQRVSEGVCYGVVGYSDPRAIRRLDVTVRIEDEIVGQDLTNDSLPIVEFCAPRTATARVELHATQGAGALAARVLAEPNSLRRSRGAGPPLLNRLMALQGRVMPRARGLTDPIVLRYHMAGALPVPFTTPSAGCWAVLAAGDPGIVDLALRVVDMRGKTRGEDRDPGPESAVLVCGDGPEALRAELLVSAGAGRVMVQIVGDLAER